MLPIPKDAIYEDERQIKLMTLPPAKIKQNYQNIYKRLTHSFYFLKMNPSGYFHFHATDLLE